MATRTSVGSGLWSAPGTWNTGVPVDGDSFVVAAGHTVTFDVDQTAMPTGMALGTVTGTLRASEVAGAYVLKLAGDLTINPAGKFLVGTSEAVPYPATCSLHIVMGTARFVSATPGGVLIYCACPTYRVARLTAGVGIGTTVLPVDTDLRGDWVDGQTVLVSDIDPAAADVELRVIAAGGVAASTITLTAGLTYPKLSGAYLALCTRNVRITGGVASASSGIFYSCIGSQVAAEIAPTSCRVFHAGTSCILLRGAVTYNLTGDGIGELVRCEFRGVHNAILLANGPEMLMNGAYILGCRHGTYACRLVAIDTVFAGCTNALTRSCGQLIRCTFVGNGSDLAAGQSDQFTAYSSNVGWPGANNYWAERSLCQSFDHAGVAGEFSAKSKGGSVVSTAAVKPTGRVRSYAHVCASATYPCWHQREITVDAGRQLRARVWLRHEAGVAVVAQLVLPTDDPLLDAAATAEDTFDASALAADTWHEDVLVWTNTATYPQQILLRFLATAASGYAYSDFEWAFDRTPRGRHGIA